MRIRHVVNVFLLSSPVTLAATLPSNSALSLQSTPLADLPTPPFCLSNDPVCPRTLMADCNGLLRLLTLNDAGARQLRVFVFRPPETPGEWQVPCTFTSGTCRLTIAMVPGEILEFSSFAEVAAKAMPLVTGCLGPTTPQYHGGYNLAGVADSLMVLLHGIPARNSVLTLGGGVANHTRADLTRRAVDEGMWCRTIDEGKVYRFPEFQKALNAANGSVDGSGTGSVERADVTK